MKRHAELIVSAVIVIYVLCGCTVKPLVWKSDPMLQSVSNEYFDVKLTPVADVENTPGVLLHGIKCFLLTINNKTGKTMELNWNKTHYVSGDQTYGGFMYEGIVIKERNEPKMSDVVFPGVVFQKKIWPNNLVQFDAGTSGTSGTSIKGRYIPGSSWAPGPGWVHRNMPPGSNGVYLTMVVDGKEINEKLTVDLTLIK